MDLTAPKEVISLGRTGPLCAPGGKPPHPAPPALASDGSCPPRPPAVPSSSPRDLSLSHYFCSQDLGKEGEKPGPGRPRGWGVPWFTVSVLPRGQLSGESSVLWGGGGEPCWVMWVLWGSDSRPHTLGRTLEPQPPGPESRLQRCVWGGGQRCWRGSRRELGLHKTRSTEPAYEEAAPPVERRVGEGG